MISVDIYSDYDFRKYFYHRSFYAGLKLSMLAKIFSRRHTVFFLAPVETICMKCQNPFLGKNKKNVELPLYTRGDCRATIMRFKIGLIAQNLSNYPKGCVYVNDREITVRSLCN